MVAPVLESLLGQLLVFRVAARFRLYPGRPWLTVALSALWFGSMHFYSASYILSTSAVGVVLAGAFALAGAGARAYWLIVVAHALINSVAALVVLFGK